MPDSSILTGLFTLGGVVLGGAVTAANNWITQRKEDARQKDRMAEERFGRLIETRLPAYSKALTQIEDYTEVIGATPRTMDTALVRRLIAEAELLATAEVRAALGRLQSAAFLWSISREKEGGERFGPEGVAAAEKSLEGTERLSNALSECKAAIRREMGVES